MRDPRTARPGFGNFRIGLHPDSNGLNIRLVLLKQKRYPDATKIVAMGPIMPARIAPAERPYEPDMEATLARLMPPGREPLLFFRTMARDPRLFRRLMTGGLLDKGNLSLREREIAIDRTCARCGAEYEWGVHIAFFGERVGFGAAERQALLAPAGGAACWSAREWLIVRLADQLHDTATIDDALWGELTKEFRDEQLIELIMLAGAYHMISFLVNAMQLPSEAYAARFPAQA